MESSKWGWSGRRVSYTVNDERLGLEMRSDLIWRGESVWAAGGWEAAGQTWTHGGVCAAQPTEPQPCASFTLYLLYLSDMETKVDVLLDMWASCRRPTAPVWLFTEIKPAGGQNVFTDRTWFSCPKKKKDWMPEKLVHVHSIYVSIYIHPYIYIYIYING